MVEEKQPLAHFDDIKIERSAQTTTNQEKRKSDCGWPSAIAAFMQATRIWEIGR
jgi:hypothetical protein